VGVPKTKSNPETIPKLNPRPNIVVIGGGTGSYVVLNGLKDKPVNLTAVISMMDSGGSTGRLRDQLGVLPPGDVRQALVSLSDSPEIWRKLFSYRFENGDLGGHSFGNIFLSALEKITGSPEEALQEASEILKVRGRVLPVTYSKCTLCAKYEDESLIEGEDKIDSAYTKRPRIRYMFLAPEATLNPKAKKAIEEADLIVLGPGDLYTSIIPNLLITGISDTIADSRGKKVFIANLMTKLGQTDGFNVSDHILELDKYLGSGFLDYVIVNSVRPAKNILDWYKKADNVEYVLDDLLDRHVVEAKIIRADVLSKAVYKRGIADRLKRSLIRHDPKKVAKVLLGLLS
jgi:uncharacterized cofD-like protein